MKGKATEMMGGIFSCSISLWNYWFGSGFARVFI